jgi:hypothetical protein
VSFYEQRLGLGCSGGRLAPFASLETRFFALRKFFLKKKCLVLRVKKSTNDPLLRQNFDF